MSNANYKLNFTPEVENVPKDKVRIVVKKVKQAPSIELIDNTLEAKQKIVDGLIEILCLDNDIVMVCNEEGKCMNLEPNLLLDYDYIAGDCFFIGDDYENADFKSLTEKQITEVEKFINKTSIVDYNEPSDGREI